VYTFFCDAKFPSSYIKITDVFHLNILVNSCLSSTIHLLYPVLLQKLPTQSYFTNRIGHEISTEKVLISDYYHLSGNHALGQN